MKTQTVELPFALYTSPQAALDAVNHCARQRAWETVHIRPVDGRVVWIILEDRIVLYYRPIEGGHI